MNKKLSKELFKLNLHTTILLIVVNILVLLLWDNSKNGFTVKSFYFLGVFLVIYLFLLLNKVKTNYELLQKEVLFINYQRNIIFFIGFIVLTLLVSAITLFIVNNEAASIVFIFIFFMSTISMLMPLIIFVSFVLFVVPLLIIPFIKSKKNFNILKCTAVILLIPILIFTIKLIKKQYDYSQNFERQIKFPGSKLSIYYSTKYLKLSDEISAYAKKKMSKNTIKVPILYLTDPIAFSEKNQAYAFCNSLNAKIPNYLEAYHLVFNRFDTFGDKYYWTSNKDNGIPLVLHYKNMSYEIVRLPKNVKPELYCMVNATEGFSIKSKYFFYRDIPKTIQNDEKNSEDKNPITKILGGKLEFPPIETQNIPINIQKRINNEKKRIYFSVKEVSSEYFNDLLNKGYYYNPSDTIESRFVTNSAVSYLDSNQSEKIRQCYYPFIDYGNLSMNAEREIWEQSFCSPAFDIINSEPVMKTKDEKDTYCSEMGGRLPNIPELTGILKVKGQTQPDVKYWTNNKITGTYAISRPPLYVYFKDSQFVKVEAADENINQAANVYCIKDPQVPSLVIANYKSRFRGEHGGYLAKQKCMNCRYFEVPDVILKH